MNQSYVFIFGSAGLFGRMPEDEKVTCVSFSKYQIILVLSILCFRAPSVEEDVKYADCLCGQKKNFAMVMFYNDLVYET